MIVGSMLRLVAARAPAAPSIEQDDERDERARTGTVDDLDLDFDDDAAVATALNTLLPEVRRALYRLLGPSADLDDAVQDALVEIANALPRFERRAAMTTFAYRITVRVAYRYFGASKKRGGDVSLELVAPPCDAVDPESVAMAREALRRLYRCLDRLPKKRRVAFALCAMEGLTPLEASEILGTRASIVRSRYFHARREVERMLAADPYVRTLLGATEEVSS